MDNVNNIIMSALLACRNLKCKNKAKVQGKIRLSGKCSQLFVQQHEVNDKKLDKARNIV